MVKSVLQLQAEGWARTIERRGCEALDLGTGDAVRGVLRPRKEDPVVYAPEGGSNTASPNRYVFTSVDAPLRETARITLSAIPGNTFQVVDVDMVTDGEAVVYYRATVKIEDDV